MSQAAAAGPSIQALVHRLAACPQDFLMDPIIGKKGSIHTVALVSDILLEMGRAVIEQKEADSIEGGTFKPRVQVNRLRMIQVACWLLGHSWFQGRKELCPKVLLFLAAGLDDLAGMIDASLLVTDQDRREELARLLLDLLELTPEGETQAQAADRLESISSVMRRKVLEQTKQAEARARKIREELAKKAAAEAAAKTSRE
ncbi:MAG: hypothetical protein OEV92_06470 [Nitrospinota bacterium]|nr:hypothetical protein [Nitrospinota bacterium]